MSIDCETGALIGCFGTFGTTFVGSETTTVDTSRSLLTPAVHEGVVELETCDSPETVEVKERLLVMKACSLRSVTASDSAQS
jgi:hypothetical protein